ncbi:MAG TPA: biotin-dependent carboxyltransferase family protein [Chitinophaga sp.]|uniref:5-oxoprolinase subunit C family protein n=1 Tax=Chitinophaga sp. TaxID=1869181 RepID=UPI002BC8E2B4|nr:biotin-dependent carboxyltransferase family protein [Chitinophaga sp.]HVI47837.1 biotin-dependent carboxyltransferase family protein [Chitinophaga sp.]
MSILTLQQGILDTIQDRGRYGFQHLGINPGGVMDRVAMTVANCLVGNAPANAVIELHFPAGRYLFEAPALIALSGAGFSAMADDTPLPLNRPVLIAKGATLSFKRMEAGARCYLAIRYGLMLTPWLGSNSTHLKAAAGGYHGRQLQKNDRLLFTKEINIRQDFITAPAKLLPWIADTAHLYNRGSHIRIIPGGAWALLDVPSQQQLLTGNFLITQHSDRMGFRLQGTALQTVRKEEQLSSGVCRGAIQLLPDGQLIVLMADHQTTGGYPLIAHVITADMPSLSQYLPGQTLQFENVNSNNADAYLWQQDKDLCYLQHACNLRLEKWLSQYDLH